MPCKNKACCINKARTIPVTCSSKFNCFKLNLFQSTKSEFLSLVCSVVVTKSICCFDCDQQLTSQDITGEYSNFFWCQDTQAISMANM